MPISPKATADRVIKLGPECAALPERLLLAHARGQVLFITGAGTSQAANLPDFRGLVLQTYQKIDPATYAVLKTIPRDASSHHQPKLGGLRPQQLPQMASNIQSTSPVWPSVGAAAIKIEKTCKNQAFWTSFRFTTFAWFRIIVTNRERGYALHPCKYRVSTHMHCSRNSKQEV